MPGRRDFAPDPTVGALRRSHIHPSWWGGEHPFPRTPPRLASRNGQIKLATLVEISTKINTEFTLEYDRERISKIDVN